MAFPIREDQPPRSFRWATWTLIGICLFTFAFIQPKPMQGGTHGLDMASNARAELQVQEFLDRYALIPCEFSHRKSMSNGAACDGYPSDHPERYPPKSVYLPLLTVLFLHGSILHLLSNILFLWLFGRSVEERLGELGVWALFLAGGIASSLGYVAMHTESTEPMIGASGAIAALMGAYLVLLPRRRILSVVYSAGLQFTYLPAWAVLGFFFGSQFFTAPGAQVAWEAHVFGMAFGAIVAGVISWRDPTRRENRTPVQLVIESSALPQPVVQWPAEPPLRPPT